MNEWNELAFSFEESPWDGLLAGKKPGEAISAAGFLTVMEGEPEEAVADALLEMEEKFLLLDVSDLPAAGSGEAALRLRQEKQFVKGGSRLTDLEPEDPLRRFLEEVAAAPAFGEEAQLAERCARGDADAREQLANLGLSRVISFAEEYAGRGVLLLDLIQEGSLGLWQGICGGWNSDYGAKRDYWIRFAMQKAVTMQARENGMGEKMRRAIEDYRAVDERLLGELGRNATLEEIAENLHMTVEETAVVGKMLDDARLLARVKKQPDPEEEAEEQAVEDTAAFQMRQRILDLLSGLNREDSTLLTLRYGLEGGKPLSPEETGRRLNLTPSEVVEREAAILTKLRQQK